MMRAKMKVLSVNWTEFGQVLNLTAVTNGTQEDNTYSKFTPCGSVELTITNPELEGKFKPGQQFYVDFTEA